VTTVATQDRAVTSGAGFDIELEILRHKFQAIAGEMGVVLANAAQSPQINQELDFAVALADRWGGVAAIDNPLHLGSIARTTAGVLEYFKFDMKDGDVTLVNDPYRGGTHVQDTTLVMPYVLDNAIVLYLIAQAHLPDMGGQIAGNYNPIATEIWAEGVPISPVKIRRYARPVRDIVTTVLLNTRRPDETRRDLESLLATLELGRRRVDELVDVYGIERLREALAYTQSYAERRARAEILSWTDGLYEGERTLDHDCAGSPVTVRVAATIALDELHLDFSASDEQRPSFVNSTLSNTVNFALLPVLLLLGPDVPVNSGILRSISVRCDPGLVTNARFPAPVGWSTSHCGAEIAEATAAAIAPASRFRAGALTCPQVLVMGRPERDRHDQIDLSLWAVGGAAGVPGRDGWGRPDTWSRSILPSIERWEVTTGMRVHELELVPDSGGAGRWRGAPGFDVVIEVPEGWLYTLVVEGRDNPAGGVAGGRAGAPAAVTIVAVDGSEMDVSVVQVEQGIPPGRMRIRLGGGGGYGEPFEREAGSVVEDVANGLVTLEGARRDYGVASRDDGTLDEEATASLRSVSGS
jgi:N-methylhydantoinase B